MRVVIILFDLVVVKIKGINVMMVVFDTVVCNVHENEQEMV